MKNLKSARLKKGYTQASLSKKLGVSRSTVAMWETGESRPDTKMLSLIADCLGVSTDYLLDRDPMWDEWHNAQFALSAPEGYDALTEEGKQQILELIKILPKKEGASQ